MAHNSELRSNTIRCTDIQWQFTAGASGAVPTDPASTSWTRSKDLLSASDTGTGVHTFNLQRGWTALVHWDVKIKQASYAKSGACAAILTTDDVAAAVPKVVLTFVDGDGDAVDLAEGDIVRIQLRVKRSAGLA